MSYLPDSAVPQADVRSRRGGARVGASPGLRWVSPAAALVVALATSVGVPGPAPAASSTAAPASGAAERAGQVALSPGQLPRGENTKLPVVVGDYIVSGQSRARVRAPNWYLVGASGSGWVVVTSDKNFNDARVVRVGRGGTQRVLVRDIDVDTVSLSSDGRYVLRSEVRTGGEKLRSVVRVHDAASGALVGKQRLAGVREVLDLAGGWAVVSGDRRHPTVWWKVGTAQVRTLDRRAAFFVDLGEGLMGYAKGDPYQGGCSFLATAPLPGQASRPGLDRWRSCDWAVVAAAPGGARVLAIPNTTDGIGTNVVQLRTAERGRVMKTYKAASYFGRVAFESPRSAVLDVHSRRYAAPVRCVLANCERAGQLVRESLYPRVPA